MDVFLLFSEYGLLAIFVCVLIEQMGAPIPALPILVLAGVTSANDGVFAVEALAVATGASMLSDTLWFFAGRRFGLRVLGLLCRISISPDSCVRQSELNFARRGPATLVLAKFIPGVSILASPLAGALGMKWRNFALLNVAGIVLWAGSGICFGLIFHENALQLLKYLSNNGSSAFMLIVTLLAIYILIRVWRRWKLALTLKKIPRVAPIELSDLIARGMDVVIVDVRASVSLSMSDQRIPGASHMDLGEVSTIALDAWSPDAKIVIYCACPNDASALKAANALIKRGYRVHVLDGGIAAWTSAGYALQTSTQ